MEVWSWNDEVPIAQIKFNESMSLDSIIYSMEMMDQIVRLPEDHGCITGRCAYDETFGNDGTTELSNAIFHLNDDSNWSRERIADWVDELHEAGIINAEFSRWEIEE